MSEPSCPPPAKAYNLEILHEEARPGPECHGWCFGLPPGISPAQWPLDPATGYPLVHGFTLRLPPDYRCHGPEFAGLSLFACCHEHSDGGTAPDQAIASVMSGATAPDDARYLPFWNAVRSGHPRLFRMADVLGDSFAAILLREAELNGPLCRPPDIAAASALSCHGTPQWIAAGSGRAYFDWLMSYCGTAQRDFIHNILGGIPDIRPDWNRALRWRARADDPNAGKAPEDGFAAKKISGYQQPYYYEGGVAAPANFRKHGWTADHARDHIGGHHAADAGNAALQPVLCRVRRSSWRLQFRRRQLLARFPEHAARLGVRVRRGECPAAAWRGRSALAVGACWADR